MALSTLRGVRRALPLLANFYMVGQWVWPGGGLNAVALAGRDLLKRLRLSDATHA
jgi:phytoene dehydrogenase-like protein